MKFKKSPCPEISRAITANQRLCSIRPKRLVPRVPVSIPPQITVCLISFIFSSGFIFRQCWGDSRVCHSHNTQNENRSISWSSFVCAWFALFVVLKSSHFIWWTQSGNIGSQQGCEKENLTVLTCTFQNEMSYNATQLHLLEAETEITPSPFLTPEHLKLCALFSDDSSSFLLFPSCLAVYPLVYS